MKYHAKITVELFFLMQINYGDKMVFRTKYKAIIKKKMFSLINS